MSLIKDIAMTTFPRPTGLRVMMMPFHMGDKLPWNVEQYDMQVAMLLEHVSFKDGDVGYLTIDEARLKAGEVHRRPGLHVDGLDESGRAAGWGGGGGGYGARGMITAASVEGCRAWDQYLGDLMTSDSCENLRDFLKPDREVKLRANRAYWVDPLCVHEGLPMERGCFRQFLRISMPSDCPWYEGYTENPWGVKPTGEIRPKRVTQMGYRP